MEEVKNIQRDFKKWILFNPLINDYESLYNLYCAVEQITNRGNAECRIIEKDGEKSVRISQQGVDSDLELNESERTTFLEYLVQHYIPSEDVEEWYLEKSGGDGKAKNHDVLKSKQKDSFSGNKIEIKPHKKERKYYHLKLFFSVLFYFALIAAMVTFYFTDQNTFIGLVLSIVLTIIFTFILRRITMGFFVGRLKGRAVKIESDQFPDVFEIVKDQCHQLDIQELPEIYVVNGEFNAFVTRFARTKFLVLYSEVVESSLTGNNEVLKFVIGHELGHIKRKHLYTNRWLFPSTFVPLLELAYSRGREYTCDRIGYSFSSKGAIEGILILSTGQRIHSQINADKYLENSLNDDSFWMWFSEKFTTHPYLPNRLEQIKLFDSRGY